MVFLTPRYDVCPLVAVLVLCSVFEYGIMLLDSLPTRWTLNIVCFRFVGTRCALYTCCIFGQKKILLLVPTIA